VLEPAPPAGLPPFGAPAVEVPPVEVPFVPAAPPLTIELPPEVVALPPTAVPPALNPAVPGVPLGPSGELLQASANAKTPRLSMRIR
jgi:hypothetical protein